MARESFSELMRLRLRKTESWKEPGKSLGAGEWQTLRQESQEARLTGDSEWEVSKVGWSWSGEAF